MALKLIQWLFATPFCCYTFAFYPASRSPWPGQFKCRRYSVLGTTCRPAR